MPTLAAQFAEAMRLLGPFGPQPQLALAVSGGADSTALAFLARDWAHGRDGSVIALIADHGLRPESAAQAASTASLMTASGIAAQIIRLTIPPGAALQERARSARHAALAAAAHASGAVHLLFGHHAGDQAELLAMRAARGQGGAAGMAAFSARHDVVLLRPLLAIEPAALRAALIARGNGWIEDPSNQDERFERIRIRRAGTASPNPIVQAAVNRAHDEAQAGAADYLAHHARILPAGFALLHGPTVPADVLSALLRTIGGKVHPPRRDAVARLAQALRPATLAGVRIMPAGRFGRDFTPPIWPLPVWLLCREPAACASTVAAVPGASWDSRFRIRCVPPGADRLGCLGDAAPGFRTATRLPSVVLRALPTFFRGAAPVAIPHCTAAPFAILANAPSNPATAMPATRPPQTSHSCV